MQVNENYDGDKFSFNIGRNKNGSAIRNRLLNNRIRDFFANDGRVDKEERKILRQEGYSRKEINQAIEDYNDRLNRIREIKETYETVQEQEAKPNGPVFGLE